MMKIITCFFTILLFVQPARALITFGPKISSRTAVSQAGRFAFTYDVPLVINKESSLKLTNFITYQNPLNKNNFLIGPIPGEHKLEDICQNPIFLTQENILSASELIPKNNYYFKNKRYKACVINFIDKTALIVQIPKPFINQAGEKIQQIGIVANTEDVDKIKNHISFEIEAKDFYINLLQLSQTFSPYSNEIDWDSINEKGINFIGDEKTICRGLSAAVQFLIPALYQQDLHSFISLNGLGTPLCSSITPPYDDGMQKWLSLPDSTRSKIIKYTSDFHGYQLIKRISYLYVPSMDAFDPDTIDDKITKGRLALRDAKIDEALGLIVDLRFNLGGSLVPMLLSISNVLSSGYLFNLGKETAISLSTDRNKININNEEIYGQYNGHILNLSRAIPIAILTNQMTASSANILALILRNKAFQVRVFGEKTSPTTSINATFYLLDGNTFNLTVDRVYDKNGKKSPLELSVDYDIKDNLETIFEPSLDETLLAAKLWLEKQNDNA